MKHIITLLLTCITLVVMCANCGGRMTQADCSYMGKGANYCGWETDDYKWQEQCCPPAYPYCGKRGTNCPIGKCCNTQPV